MYTQKGKMNRERATVGMVLNMSSSGAPKC